jgi:hypothetical protein
MTASHPFHHDRTLDASLEAAWLNHPCSPIETIGLMERYLASGEGTPDDRTFAHVMAASSAVRVAETAKARNHLAHARASLSRSTARTPIFQRLLHLVHGVHAASSDASSVRS